MIVHCCHCTWCQKETGSAFAVNALLETNNIELLQGEIKEFTVDSKSGVGQNIVRCSKCYTALWSHYGAAKEKVAFIRVGTLENPDACAPDIHIYTSTKRKWLTLSDDVPAVPEFYKRSEYWPESSVIRYKNAKESVG